MKIALVAIAKNEENYIEEWAKWHLNLDFDRIVVYRNDWNYDKRIEGVEYRDISGHCQQLNAYNHAIVSLANQFDWCLMLDVDEFLDVSQYKDAKQMFADYDQFLAVGFNWRMVGSSGLKGVVDGNYSVVDRFTKCQKGYNRHIKTAIHLSLVPWANQFRFATPHHIVCPYGMTTMSADKKHLVAGPFNEHIEGKHPFIRHYFCKSEEEWKSRRAYGRADLDPSRDDFVRTMADFYENDLNAELLEK